ncbi:MAG TPA: HD domain-containing phosphohydrolase [Candidatus Binatia bacterium]|nr:HD domain-containing phosphohydrolase [Candidatus Binatia bacterium]
MPLGLSQELVLIAEDDAANRALLSRLLERSGYRSIAVADGRDALKAAVDAAPDLVLLDVGLPGLNGLDVCRRLRADPRTVALPIILVTGQAASRDVVAGLDAGADDFVRKPYDEAELMARIRSVLRLARVTAEMVGAHGVIAALANAVEAKDAMTEMHCQRLASLAHQLGMAAGMEPAGLKGLVFGALLHDIGKIGVSDAILNKPGPLSREEWAEMRLHPIIGERICEPLATASQFSSIVRHHHERWDGAGYPDGLRGEQIPTGARIVGLVDAFDAIIHERPYRPARSVEEALEELRREAGSQFDPELVRLFIPMIEHQADELRTPNLRALEALRTAV